MTQAKTFLADLIVSAADLRRCMKWAALTFSSFIGLLILAPFPHYFSADLDYGFLRSKGDYFFSSGYYIGFYAHIVGAPLAFFAGSLQVSRTLRFKWPRFHRMLGRVYCCSVLLLAFPGGLVMALKAYGGWSSTLCFALLSILMGAATVAGWRVARLGNYRQHSTWMLRSYLLIASAIFLRILHPMITTFGLDHEFTYQISVWVSWLFPLCVFEIFRLYSNHAPSKQQRTASG